MEIHRPKLAHNWREFAAEMGIIICGILIALGLEQAAEWLHRRAEVTEAREALRSEIAQNARIALITVEEGHCLDAALGQVVRWVQGGPAPASAPVTGFVRPVFSTWDTVKAGAVPYMPLKERLEYSRLYDTFQADLENHARQVNGVNELAADLAYFATPGAPPPSARDPAVRHALGVIAAVGNVTALRARMAARSAEAAKAMGVTPAPLSANSREQLVKFCGTYGVAPHLQ